jgi:hypothetical protein
MVIVIGILILVTITLTIRWTFKRFSIVERIEQRLIRLRFFLIKVLRICFLLVIGTIAISSTYYWSGLPSDREKIKTVVENYTESVFKNYSSKSHIKRAKHQKRVETKPSITDGAVADSDVPHKLSRKEKKAKKREEKIRHQHEKNEKKNEQVNVK